MHLLCENLQFLNSSSLTKFGISVLLICKCSALTWKQVRCLHYPIFLHTFWQLSACYQSWSACKIIWTPALQVYIAKLYWLVSYVKVFSHISWTHFAPCLGFRMLHISQLWLYVTITELGIGYIWNIFTVLQNKQTNAQTKHYLL